MGRVMLIVFLTISYAFGVDNQTLVTMPDTDLALFIRLFRSTLMNKATGELNTTLEMTATLDSKVTACSGIINGTIDRCKSCTKSACIPPSIIDKLRREMDRVVDQIEDGIKNLGTKVTQVMKLLGDEAGNFINSLHHLAGFTLDRFNDKLTDTFQGVLSAAADLTRQISHLTGSALDKATDGLEHTIDGVQSGLHEIGHLGQNAILDPVGNVLDSLGSNLGHLGSSLGHVFGRRELTKDQRECMSKCDECRPLLLPENQIPDQLCDPSIKHLSNEIMNRTTKINGIVEAATNETHPIVIKVEYDMASGNAQMQLTRVFLTVRLNGNEERYQTAVPYSMMHLADTVRNMAMEYWNKFK